jgi:hypothetical protein
MLGEGSTVGAFQEGTLCEKWLRAGRESRLADDSGCPSPYHQKNERSVSGMRKRFEGMYACRAHLHSVNLPRIELLDDTVARDGLTNHWPESYVDETGQVNESGGVDGALQRGSLASRASARGYVPNGTISTKYAESRADHGLENFGGSLYSYGTNGRHVGTRTPDLYRVKETL